MKHEARNMKQGIIPPPPLYKGGNIVLFPPLKKGGWGGFVLLLASCFMLLSTLSANAQTLTLPDVISRALTNNPQIQAVREEAKAAKARIPQAVTPENPIAEIEFDKTPASTSNINEAMSKNYGIKQEIPFPGKLISKGASAKNEYRASQNMLSFTELQIINEVKKVYLDILFVNKKIEIEKENETLFKRYKSIAETKYATGLAAFDEPIKAGIEAVEFEAMLKELEQEQETLFANLSYLLNEEVSSSTELKEFEASPFNETLEELKTAANKGQPELKVALFEKAAAKNKLSLARQEFFPDITAGIKYNQQKDLENAWTASIGLSLPLWSFGKQIPAMREAKAMKNAAEKRYENSKIRLDYMVTSAFEKIKSSKRVAELYGKTILPKSRAALKSAEQSYLSNKKDYIDLLDTARKWREYKIDYYHAKTDYEKAVADMETLVGALAR